MVTKLYVKQHSVTGLLYFGKTTRDDVYTYKGSGKRWEHHIRAHGPEFVKTLWVGEFADEKELVEFALAFSELFDIVSSPQWANLKEENGLDGSPKGVVFSEEHRRKISESNKSKPKRQYTKRQPTPEAIAARAAGLKGRKRTEAECKAISEGKRGKRFSEEHKQRLSEAAKRRHATRLLTKENS